MATSREWWCGTRPAAAWCVPGSTWIARATAIWPPTPVRPSSTSRPGDPGAYSAGFTFRLCNVDLAEMEADLERRGLIPQVAHAVKPGTTRPDLVRLGIDMGRLRGRRCRQCTRYFLSCSLARAN